MSTKLLDEQEDFLIPLGDILAKSLAGLPGHADRELLPDAVAKKVGRYLRACRSRRQWTREYLAKATGLSSAELCALEAGLIPAAMIDAGSVRVLAEALGEDLAMFALLLQRPLEELQPATAHVTLARNTHHHRSVSGLRVPSVLVISLLVALLAAWFVSQERARCCLLPASFSTPATGSGLGASGWSAQMLQGLQLKLQLVPEPELVSLVAILLLVAAVITIGASLVSRIPPQYRRMARSTGLLLAFILALAHIGLTSVSAEKLRFNPREDGRYIPNPGIGYQKTQGFDPTNIEVVSETVETTETTTETMPLSAEAVEATTTIRPVARNNYIANPGIGWRESHDMDTPLLPETVAYRRPEYSWRLLNPSPGVYNWSPIDADLQDAIAEGKQLSFRIYTMRGSGYGGHQMPGWVFERGVALRSNGEPDYANCAYQEEWGRFVDALRARYDGNSNIAFIDISGYGQFNEWNYGDHTTWEDGTPDAMARQRLADIFIGGSATIQCRDSEWRYHTVQYNYRGFRETQLLMPYGGIQKTSRYVAGRRPDVGIRHDCLGSARHTDSFMDKIGDVVEATWRTAPIVFEFCGNSHSEANFFSNALTTLQQAHGSIVHDNLSGDYSVSVMSEVIRLAGYRYVLKQGSHPSAVRAGNSIDVSMTWANTGYAPAYERMGQDLRLRVYLLDSRGRISHLWNLEADPNTWMPADPLPGSPPEQQIQERLRVPGSLAGGSYRLAIGIIDTRTEKPIELAIEGRDANGLYPLGEILISEAWRTWLSRLHSDVRALSRIIGVAAMCSDILCSKGEPDYVSAYREEWRRFVDALRVWYAGNSNIALINISGYSQFNEWNWGDYTSGKMGHRTTWRGSG
jgi:transcriptional regulator with XRE-family HTH domain